MKHLITILVFLFSLSAFAETCSYVLKDRWGQPQLEPFSAWARDYYAACTQAQNDCERALRDGQYNGRWFGGYCERDDFGRYPNPPRYPVFACESAVTDPYGRIIDVGYAEAYDQREACMNAEQQCKIILAQRDIRYARCGDGYPVTPRRDDRRPPPQRTVTLTCLSERLDPSGAFIESYQGSATGYEYQSRELKAQACDEAALMCQRELKGRQSCRVNR